ncbi:MAG: hypothetical protein HKN76_17935 [Saprospiraceae bacterium]|nr:hypothetical protein [Saprospiraceae bacterium]
MYRIVIASVLLVFACKTPPFNPATFSEDLITIGEGGGFAGIETRYYFTPVGKVYQQTGRDSSLKKLPDINRELVSQVQTTASEVGLHDYTYVNPGNVYKFITLRSDGRENKIVWSHADDGVKPVCPAIFDLLKQSIKNN